MTHLHHDPIPNQTSHFRGSGDAETRARHDRSMADLTSAFLPKTLRGQRVGVLVTDGTDPAVVSALKSALAGAGARTEVVAPTMEGVTGKGGNLISADHQLAGGAPTFFDAVVVAASEEGAAALEGDRATILWIRDAYAQLKVIGVTESATSLMDAAWIPPADGIITIKGRGIGGFIESAMLGRVWERAKQK